jgi:hypothetical protein
VLLSLLLSAALGCAPRRAEPEAPAITWGSSRIREIEREWTSLRGVVGMGDKGLTLWIETHKLFKDRFSARDVRDLAAACNTLPTKIDCESFQGRVFAFVIESLIGEGDRAAVVALLTCRCPSRVEAADTIEHFLCFRGGMPRDSFFTFWLPRLNDPILVLGEAYAISQIPETRHELATAVRRGFADLPVHGNGDADYVANAMRWYEKEKDHLEFNSYYAGNEMGRFSVERYEREPDLYENPGGEKRQPLFVSTPSPAWLRHARRVFFPILLLYILPPAMAVIIGLWWFARRKRSA